MNATVFTTAYYMKIFISFIFARSVAISSHDSSCCCLFWLLLVAAVEVIKSGRLPSNVDDNDDDDDYGVFVRVSVSRCCIFFASGKILTLLRHMFSHKSNNEVKQTLIDLNLYWVGFNNNMTSFRLNFIFAAQKYPNICDFHAYVFKEMRRVACECFRRIMKAFRISNGCPMEIYNIQTFSANDLLLITTSESIFIHKWHHQITMLYNFF